MIAHTQTLFASVALVATTMAFCLILVGQFRRNDGLLTVACGVFAHALAYVCYTLYGQASLWVSYALANSLLSLTLAFYTASIFRIHALSVPWWRIFILPLLMALLMVGLINTREPRMLAASGVLIIQCMLIVFWAYSHAQPNGRAHRLLIIGGGISLIGLFMRVVAISSGAAPDMHYDSSNLKQSISISIGTVTVMMLSFGLVLLSKERSESILNHMAQRDALTGIFNRRAILERLSDEVARARRAGRPLAIAMIDIDHFKSINDLHGHMAGDEVLSHFVRHLVQRLRQTDCIGRYGGEEFLLLLPDTNSQGAVALVDGLRESVAGTPAQFAKLRINLSFSSGIWCGVPMPEDTSDSLIAKADAALYAAKIGGRNTLRIADAEHAEAV